VRTPFALALAAAALAAPERVRPDTEFLLELAEAEEPNLEAAVRTIDRRLKRAELPGASAEPFGPRRILVRAALEQDAGPERPERARQVRSLLAARGALRFRIVLDPGDAAWERLRPQFRGALIRAGGRAASLSPRDLSPEDARRFPHGVRCVRVAADETSSPELASLLVALDGGASRWIGLELDGEDLASADLAEVRCERVLESEDPARWGVAFSIRAERREAMARLTARPGSRLAILLDDRVVMAPVIREPLSRDAQITGDFGHSEAAWIAAVLDSGELPCELRLVEERRLTPF